MQPVRRLTSGGAPRRGYTSARNVAIGCGVGVGTCYAIASSRADNGGSSSSSGGGGGVAFVAGSVLAAGAVAFAVLHIGSSSGVFGLDDKTNDMLRKSPMTETEEDAVRSALREVLTEKMRAQGVISPLGEK